jgi:hypothetical protein
LSQPKSVLGSAGTTEVVEGVEPAGFGFRRYSLAKVESNRREEQAIQVGAAEGHIARVCHRQVNELVQPRRGESCELAAAEHAAPRATIAVRRRPVRSPVKDCVVAEDSTFTDRSRGRVVWVGVYGLRLGVGEEKSRLSVDVDNDRTVRVSEASSSTRQPSRAEYHHSAPGPGPTLRVPVTRFPQPTAFASLAQTPERDDELFAQLYPALRRPLLSGIGVERGDGGGAGLGEETHACVARRECAVGRGEHPRAGLRTGLRPDVRGQG